MIDCPVFFKQCGSHFFAGNCSLSAVAESEQLPQKEPGCVEASRRLSESSRITASKTRADVRATVGYTPKCEKQALVYTKQTLIVLVNQILILW